MRILTNPQSVQKDYYDYLSYMYRDESITFDRRIDFKKLGRPEHFFTSSFSNYKNDEYAVGVVGFCGKIYPFVQYKSWVDGENMFSGKIYSKTETFFSYSEFEKFINLSNNKGPLFLRTDTSVKRFFKKTKELEMIFQNFLKEYPVFTVKNQSFLTISLKRKGNLSSDNSFAVFDKDNNEYTGLTGFILVANDGLFPIGFDSIVPAEQAYQEIEMFLAKKYCVEKVVNIQDKDRIAAKGFGKCSFRKCSG